jgi:hypothetical protein
MAFRFGKDRFAVLIEQAGLLAAFDAAFQDWIQAQP